MGFSIFIWTLEGLCADGQVQGAEWRDYAGRGVMLHHHWMLINLCIDNLILLRKGHNNTRLLCIKVDLYILSGRRRVHMAATAAPHQSCDYGLIPFIYVIHLHKGLKGYLTFDLVVTQTFNTS